MILHFHYSYTENSGEIRRIKNIDAGFATALQTDVIEIAFLSLPTFFKRKASFKLSKFVTKKYEFPSFPFHHSSAIAQIINSYWTSLIMLLLCLKYNPKLIIGEYSTCRQSFRFNPQRKPFVIDCHGDAIDEYRYNSKKISKLKIYFMEKMERTGIKKAKYVVCQSNAMIKFLQKKYSPSDPNKFIEYKCNASLDNFYFDQEIRKSTRKILNIEDNTTVFIYSGGLHKWQKVEESISFFKKYHHLNANSKLIILTLDKNKAIELSQTSAPSLTSSIIIESVPHDQVIKYLNAADIAFLLRDNRNLNAVASPTKLGEYMACGLPVISTEVAMNWIENHSFIFNIDTQPISDLDKFIQQVDKKQIATYAKENMNIKIDQANLQKKLHE